MSLRSTARNWRLREYKNAPAIEDALHIMMLSYEKLNQPQLADDTKRVLAGTFPDSPYITGHARPGTAKVVVAVLMRTAH